MCVYINNGNVHILITMMMIMYAVNRINITKKGYAIVL